MVIKKRLEDASDISRKRRSMPNTALGLWKFNNFLRKERVFQEPLLTGLSADICNIFDKDCISSKPHLVVLEDAITEPMIVDESAPETEAVPGDRIFQPPSHANEIIVESANGTTENVAETPSHVTKDIAESPSLTTKNIAESSSPATEVIPAPAVAQSSSSVPEFDEETEQIRTGNNIGHHDIPEFVHSPLPAVAEFSSPVTKTTVGTNALPTPDIAPFTRTHGSEFGTPKTPSEDLNFLEVDIIVHHQDPMQVLVEVKELIHCL